jgi:hypothetical protein
VEFLDIGATFGLDFGSVELVVGHSLMAIDLEHGEILRLLGLAHSYGVPVVPDTPELAPQLRAWEREILSEGFPLDPDEDSPTRYVHRRYAGVDVDSVEILAALDGVEPVMPSEVRVAMKRELGVLSEAQRVLTSLRAGIDELRALLDDTEADEHALQRCLTRHPILFGPEYVQIRPKFRLGGDFEMDFALQCSSGLVDLVEIEAASHKLFTTRGDPRAALVHAEQQVLDWLSWLEHFGELARRDLPGLQRPIGYVVIGRDSSLDEEDEARLLRRNLVLGSALQVMTYDGLLERGESLLRHFEGLRDAASAELD